MATSRRTSQQVTLVMLILASITILTLDYRGSASYAITHVRNGARDVLSPFQRAIAAAIHPLGDVVSGAFHYGQLQAENQQLRSQLGSVNNEVDSSEAAQSAASQVLELAHLPFVANVPNVPAEVISDATSNFQETVEIDRGTSNGVGVGMPVVADVQNAGLIGKVISASATTATVQLITDSGSSVPSELSLSNTGWTASGRGWNRDLALTAANGQAVPARKARVYTSSLVDGSFPAGIPFGVVHSVQRAPGGLSETVLVTPLVNLDDLQYVSVLQWLAPA